MIIALQTLIFFREALVRVLENVIRPYYKNLRLTFSSPGEESDDEESEDQVYAEYHDEKGVVFYPPMYVQRYAAVSDCLMDERWYGKLEKVVDFGYHDMSFIKYLKEVPGIKHILGVDIETIPLQCSSDIFGCDDYIPKREKPLKVTLFQGNAADPDYRLIGCDAVVAIEMIEHMLPHDLDRFVHTVFGFIKPWVVVITTPNGDFNVLFKSLEKNGLRRLDHFFEWSRGQFNEWCSNIVARYPHYTVACKGIGPGPPDTLHLGCCSQMAVFVAKNYEKQQELNINSLAVVASKDIPDRSAFGDMSSSYECIPDNMLYLTNEAETYSEYPSNKQSCVTIVLTSPIFSYETIEYQDKAFQCNLDTELGKRFLFEEESCNVLVPRRNKLYRIYEIENVNNRLNCSTLQVKKFSKTTQNLMAKNKMDALVHTREVVDEIRHLTKMLNFNTNSCNQFGDNHIWYNINWGDNAPYWNQYYKVVREYNYPFEAKSEDCRILDQISEEINRLIDSQWDDELASDRSRLEIPLHHLMQRVQHITRDVDRVKELLEWNGYQIVDDVVIHSRLVVDTASVGTQEDDWMDNDTVSDWDTSDMRSTSLSDGSTNVPEYYGRCLRRALDRKVRKLRTLLSADEDITSELDRVVCRLMKLALHTSRNRQTPVPATWMQCKLFDLLTLTEKAIERRKKIYRDEYALRAIEYDNDDSVNKRVLALNDIQEETKRADDIMYEYRHLVQPLDKEEYYDEPDSSVNLELNDNNDFFKDANSPVLNKIEEVNEPIVHEPKSKLEIVRQWVDDDYGGLSSPYIEGINQQDDADGSIVNSAESIKQEANENIELSSPISFESHKSLRNNNKYKKHKKSEIKVTKTKSKKKINFSILLKNYFIKNVISESKTKTKFKPHKKLESAIAAPIPASLIELCNETDKNDDVKEQNVKIKESFNSDLCKAPNTIDDDNTPVAATENSHVISIVTHDTVEHLALRRSIGTEPDVSDQEAIIESVINVTKEDSFTFLKTNDNEDGFSQTIFLYDINEPSTSKGIRHTGLDVQCGPDDMTENSVLSATTSFTKLPKLFSKGIKIGQSRTDVQTKVALDMATSPGTSTACSYKLPRNTFTGIWINDSDTKIVEHNICDKVDFSTMTPHDMKEVTGCKNQLDNFESKVETTLLKPVNSCVKTDGSGSDIGCVISECKMKSPPRTPTKTSNIQIQSCASKGDIKSLSPGRQIKPKLSCGGIYVHSFRDREVSEDVVYQGGWNDINPKALLRNTSRKLPPKKIVASRKLKRASNTSVKSKLIKSEANKIKRPIQIRAPKQMNVKKEQTNKNTCKKPTPAPNRNIKQMRNIKKVSSKSTIRNGKSDNEKQKRSTKPLRNEYGFIERPNIQNYLPPYLRRRQAKSAIVNNNLSKSMDSAKPINYPTPAFVRSNTDEIPTFKENPQMFVSYQVFRNEIENKSFSNNAGPVDCKEREGNGVPRRSSSPVSQHSSCSTSNSVATIRAVTSTSKVEANRKYSTSSHKSGITRGTMTTSTFNTKIKSIVKKNKNGKRTENKENIPTVKGWKNVNSGFDTSTNIMRPNSPSPDNFPLHSISLNLSKNKMHGRKSNIKVTKVKKSSEQTLLSSDLIQNRSCTDTESVTDSDFGPPSPSETVIVLDPYRDVVIEECSRERTENRECEENSINNSNETARNEIDCTTLSNVFTLEESIQKLFEDFLIETSKTPDLGTAACISESNKFVAEISSLNVTSSPASFRTVIENKNSDTFEKDLEEALNNSFDVEESSVLYTVNSSATVNLTENSRTAEITSFDSVCSSSKHSEYFLADQVDLYEAFNQQSNTGSVKDLFERKDLNIVTNVGGPIALQAFSGFSMNAVPLAGDQPEYIALVDPETGSLRQEVNRQATSEEILVSSRSSDTYESCYVEEDAFVPSWLFNIISQQQSIEDSEDDDEDRITLQMPIVEPIFDVNGNITEPGVGAGAGAGDGRGMHSDHSQDSSGRGTSLSSTETSSDAQSEYEFVRENVDATNVDRPNESPDTSFTTAEADTAEEARQRLRNRTIASDADADVSSLDTDIADSDT